MAYACGVLILGWADPPARRAITLPERTVCEVVRSPDGDFAFSMPTKPARETRNARGVVGTLEILTYSGTHEGSGYRLRRIRSPQEVRPARVIAELGRLRPRYMKANARLVKETPIVVDGVIGEDLTYTLPPVPGGGGVTERTRHFIAGHFYYALTVTSPPDRPLPEAAARFLSSLTFEALVKTHQARMRVASPWPARTGARPPRTAASPQRSPPRASARPPAADRAPRPRIPLADTTPEEALRTFLLALAAQDEETLRSVTRPDDDLPWLLRGRPASPAALAQIRSRLQRTAMRRLQPGDTARLADGTSRTLRPEDLPAGRVVLRPEGTPYATTIEDVGGH